LLAISQAAVYLKKRGFKKRVIDVASNVWPAPPMAVHDRAAGAAAGPAPTALEVVVTPNHALPPPAAALTRTRAAVLGAAAAAFAAARQGRGRYWESTS
jgi:hypothetical protein